MQQVTITECDLQAYVDDQLDPAGRLEVADYLVRHPDVAARVLEDLGFRQQAELFDRVAQREGVAPPVIDSTALREAPEPKLKALCEALGVGWTARMLHWPAGPKPYDGVWAPVWYHAVHASTGFDGAEGSMPALPDAYRRLAEAALPYYQALAPHTL